MDFDEIFGEVRRLTCNKPVTDLHGDPDHDPNSGIFDGIFTIVDDGKFTDFYGIDCLGGGLRSRSASSLRNKLHAVTKHKVKIARCCNGCGTCN